MICAVHQDGTYDVQRNEDGIIYHKRVPATRTMQMVPIGRAAQYAGQWREAPKVVSSKDLYGHDLPPILRPKDPSQALPHDRATLSPAQIHAKLTY